MSLQKIEVPIAGMDCAECTQHVQHAIAALPGVENVSVLLASEQAIVTLDPARVDVSQIRRAVADAGYSVPDETQTTKDAGGSEQNALQRIRIVLLLVFGSVLFVVIVGEWLGLFETLTANVPFWMGAVLVLVAGAPIFRNVLRAAWRRQVLSHTLMSLGVFAALAVGQWLTALVVVFFMYVGDYVESFTTDRARGALRDLEKLAPQTARVARDGAEVEVAIRELEIGDVVIVRPGEKIPVDGEVVDGQATINQAAITGEPMPIRVSAGAQVYAATIAELGGLRVRAARIGRDTTFGQVISMVEQAEANRAEVQRFADKFSAYFLPIVLTIATVTLVISRDPLATAAVLVVACSCAIALATPIAMLASIGSAARNGILIKGGQVIEALAQADIVLVDKTGTLTLGQPRITDVVPLNGIGEKELLSLAASLERESEHPLARAVVAAAQARQVQFQTVKNFEAAPGHGVSGEIGSRKFEIGKARGETGAQVDELTGQGKSVLQISEGETVLGILAAEDTLRPEIPGALRELRALGITRIELLTGDNERAAAKLAQDLDISFRANLLPQDKIQIVREYQAQGKRVVMVGDGVNDAPALAQANVGIAMRGGTDIAIQAAHVTLMREDWMLVPQVFRVARRTMHVVRMNLGFTAVYNVVGITLAAFGILPPVLAAAAQSLPDLGIMANSARLLRQK